jgi:hypothetical protein
VCITEDLHAYPVALGAIGVIVEYRGQRPCFYAPGHAPTQTYCVRLQVPHRYGDTLVLHDHEFEPVD